MEKTFADSYNTLGMVACTCDVREENFCERARIHEIRKSFLPRKFPAIRYIIALYPGLSILESSSAVKTYILEYTNHVASSHVLGRSTVQCTVNKSQLGHASQLLFIEMAGGGVVQYTGTHAPRC